MRYFELVRLGILILALMALAGCRAPTEIVVELKTDVVCSDLQGVELRVGPVQGLDERPASASTDACSSSGRIGSLVLVPSGGRSDEVAVQVVAGFGKSVDKCRPPGYGPGCIVARRALRYVPHTPLHLSIPLLADCNGVACDDTTTCRNGECVDAHIPDPSSCTSGCGEDNLKPTGPHVTANCGDMRGLQAGAAWPIANYCPTRGGHSPFSGPSGTANEWSFKSIGTPLVAAGGTVLIGSQTGAVNALHGDTGDVRWQTSVGTGLVYVEFLGAHGSVDYGTEGGAFGALDLQTGQHLWETPDVYSTDSAPIVDGEERIILVGSDGNVHAIDGGNKGARLWDYTPKSPTRGGSIGPDGKLYLAENGALAALDPATKKLLWRKALPGPSQPSLPVITDKGLVVVAGPEGTRAFDATTGETKWDAPGGGDLVAVGTDGTLFLPRASAVVALDPASGNPKWSKPYSVATTPMVDADGMLFVPQTSGEVVGLDPTSGKQVWSATAIGDNLPFGGSITAGHLLIVGSTHNGIHAVGP